MYTVVQCDRAYIRTCHRVVLEIRLSLIDGKKDKNLYMPLAGLVVDKNKGFSVHISSVQISFEVTN